MSFLTLNGLSLSTLFGKTARTDPELGNGTERTGDGSALTENRGFKTEFTSEAVVDTQANVYALRRFLRGEWDHWTFSAATGLYSDLAVPTFATSGTVAEVATGGPTTIAGRVSLSPASSAEWANTIGNAGGATYSFMTWRKATGSYEHDVVVVTAGACTQFLINGVTQSPVLPLWLSSDLTNLGVVLTTTGSAMSFADLVVMPWAMPASWGAQFYTWMSSNAWSQAPQLQMGGDMGSLLIKGEAAEALIDAVGVGTPWTNSEHLTLGLRGT
jgi:hypothetical protein